MRILILSFQALGNAVFTTPLLANLKRAWPEAEIDVVCHPPASELFAACPSVDRTLIYDRAALRGRGLLWKTVFPAAFLARVAARGYDAVLDLHGGPRSALISLAARSPLRVGYANRVRGSVFHQTIRPRKLAFDPAQPADWKRHEADHLLDFARALGMEPENLPIEAYPRPDPSPPQAAYALLHSGSSDSRKNWPAGHFAELARGIERRLDLLCRFSVGPLDDATGAELRREGVAAEALCRPRGLASLVSLIAGASLFVGNDTGPMHISAALGRPTIAVFGPTDEAFTGPRPVDPRRARVAALGLACRPCLQWGDCAGRECLSGLQPATVLDLASELLGDHPTGAGEGRERA